MKLNASAKIFQLAMTSQNPAEALLSMVPKFLEKGDMESINVIDVMLNGRFVLFSRNLDFEKIEEFAYQIVAFLESPCGEKLRKTPQGARFFWRWEQLRDLSDFVIENRSRDFTEQFVNEKRHGRELLQILQSNPEGMSIADLSKQLSIGKKACAQLIRDFIREDLVKIDRKGRKNIILLGFMGKVFMHPHT
jgi:hypothetical protein